MFFSRISVKITIWFAAFFMVGALILFALTSYLLHSSLQKKDQDLLEAKFSDYSALLARDGVSGLQFRTSKKEIPDASKFLVRYQSDSGQTLLLHVPEHMEVVGQTLLLQELDTRLKNDALRGPWLVVSGNNYGDSIEILSRKTPSGGVLQIGKDTEDREHFFTEFARSFFLGLFPVVALALAIGGALSGRVLRPIRWLTQTIQDIRSGKSAARVSLSGNGDELDRLGSLFNQMQDQNGRLVQGMRDTLDHVAHDLRTPIMRTQNSAQHALEKASNSEKQSPLYEALAECQENSESIQTMLNAILDISEAETGAMALHRENLDAEGIVASVVDLYEFVAEEKNIRLETNVAPGLLVFGDRGRLLQALANLVDNAIKFSPRDSAVKITSHRTNDEVVFEVIDRGLGISEHDRPRIWERLYRGDQSRSTHGMGLGLSLVQAIAKAHSGAAQVESSSAGGSTFRLVIPG